MKIQKSNIYIVFYFFIIKAILILIFEIRNKKNFIMVLNV